MTKADYKHTITFEPDFRGPDTEKQYREWYNSEMQKLMAKGKTFLIVQDRDGNFWEADFQDIKAE